jgi:hypothetical protein
MYTVMWKLRVRDVVVPEISVSGAFTEQWDGKWVSESVHRPSRTPSHQPLAEVKVLDRLQNNRVCSFVL